MYANYRQKNAQAGSIRRQGADAPGAERRGGPPMPLLQIPSGPGPEKPSKVLGTVSTLGAAPEGYEGGRRFGNFEGRLPVADSTGNSVSYREWDVNPRLKGVNRGAERLVTASDGSAYYTDNHYGSFLLFSGPGR
jgi:guanyl-specific ribonuclease Sa